jgi:KRAB domain-containing zinc finger protein
MRLTKEIIDCFGRLSENGLEDEQHLATFILEGLVVYFNRKLAVPETAFCHDAQYQDKDQDQDQNQDQNQDLDQKFTSVESSIHNSEIVKIEPGEITKEDVADRVTIEVTPNKVVPHIDDKGDLDDNTIERKSTPKKIPNKSSKRHSRYQNAQPMSELGPVSTQCEYCSFSLEAPALMGKYTASKLRKHKKAEHNVCEICREKLDSSTELDNHMGKKHLTENGRLLCGLEGCNKLTTYLSIQVLLHHVRTVHDRVKYICKTCNMPYRKWKSHKLEHSLELLPCTDCDLTFKSKKSLELHSKIHSGHVAEQPKQISPKLSCDSCAFQTTEVMKHKQFLLTMHKRIHNEGSLVCDMCTFVTKKPFVFKKHLTEEHDIGTVLQCTFCDYSTTSLSHFPNHVARHTREKTYKCDECDFKSHFKESIRKHKNRHRGDDAKYLCDECDYKTQDSCNFKTHKTVVHGSLILKCADCDYNTKSKRSLRQHKFKKHGSSVACTNCDYRANSEVGLKHHNRYQCSA